jgi:hypothetical protein
VLEIGPDVKDDELNLKYDRHWLAVLKNTNHLLSVEKKNRLALKFSFCCSELKAGLRIWIARYRFQYRNTDTVSCVDFAVQFLRSAEYYQKSTFFHL